MRAMTPKAARNSRSSSSVSGTLAALPRQATGTPSPLMAMWYLLPLLARSVGLGPTRSPPRLARTEQLSRIRVGLPRSIATSSACPVASSAFSAQKARNRRKVEPLGRVCKRLQPEQDHADVDHGEIVVATLLIPRSDAPGLLEAVDQPLDFVA